MMDSQEENIFHIGINDVDSFDSDDNEEIKHVHQIHDHPPIEPSHVPICNSHIQFFFALISDVLFVFNMIYQRYRVSTCSVDSPVLTYKLDIKVLNLYAFINPSASFVVNNGFTPFVA